MTTVSKALAFEGGQSNYYAQDVEKLVAFYCENFGFKESYRTPTEGTPEHVEIRLGDYLIGLSSVDAARRIASWIWKRKTKFRFRTTALIASFAQTCWNI